MDYSTTRVTNGTVTLPREVRSTWKGAQVRVWVNGSRMVLERVAHNREETAAWRRLAGIWKGRKLTDPVRWQRQIRRQWERKLP